MFFEWLINKNKEKFYPITHSDGVLVGDDKLTNVLNKKQEKLVSSENIKTINGESILGSGDIEIQGGGSEEASGIKYDSSKKNTLNSDNVQDAIDELSSTYSYRYLDLTSGMIEQGSLSAQGVPITDDYDKRLRSKDFLAVDSSCHVIFNPIDSSRYLAVIYYDANGNFMERLSWTNEKTIFTPKYPKMKFVLRINFDDITPDVINSFGISYEQKTPNIYANQSLIKGEFYSEKETCVGRWMDGKPIYQKTLYVDTLPNSSTITLSDTPDNINYIINYFGFAYSKTDIGSQRPLPFPSADTVNDIRIDYVDNKIRMITVADWRNYRANLTIKYTKNTDTADTPIPQLADKLLIKGEYYSEEETCIGRWMNKPLYQKTIRFDNIQTTNPPSEATIPHGIDNIDSVMFDESESYFLNDNGSIIINTTMYPNTTSFADYVCAVTSVSKTGISYCLGRARTGYSLVVTLKYTKTIDTEETPIPESVLPTSLIKGEFYSTDEKCVGRYIDGKPLYQKLIRYEQAITTIGSVKIGTLGTSVSFALVSKYSIRYSDGSTYISGWNSNSVLNSGVEVRSNGDVYIHVNETWRSPVVNFVVEYTKVSDTPDTPIPSQTFLTNNEVQAMIDASIGSVLGGEF